MSVYYLCWNAGLESLLETINTCHNHPEKSSTTKINKHTASSYSLCSFDATKNKLDFYRVKSCMKNLCQDLREHAAKLIDSKKKEMMPLTNQEKNYIVSKKFAMYEKK